jgi:hypothetical protein
MSGPCESPLSLDELVAYRSGELDANADAAVEAHFFACATCGGQLEWLQRLGDAVVAAMQRGLYDVFVTSETVARLEQSGSAVRKYVVEAGSPVSCTIAPEDDMTVVSLRGPRRPHVPVSLVAEFLDHASGQSFEVVLSAYQEPRTGDVLIRLAGPAQKALGHVRVTLALRFGDGPTAEVVGPFVLNHSPWPGSA